MCGAGNTVRLERKLPTTSSDVSWSDVLIAFFRVRPVDAVTKLPEPGFHQVLQRLLHTFAQAVEIGVEKDVTSTCPNPTLAAQIHPFQKHSRMVGNSSFKQSLIQRFMARGGGFISTKNEQTLKDLRVIPFSSNLGTRTSVEYAARVLMKVNKYLSEHTATHRVINYCFDAAMVGEEHVSLICILI